MLYTVQQQAEILGRFCNFQVPFELEFAIFNFDFRFKFVLAILIFNLHFQIPISNVSLVSQLNLQNQRIEFVSNNLGPFP